MNKNLYEGQNRFGLSSWIVFAVNSGVPDSVAFEKCLAHTDSVAIVQAGISVGNKLKVLATPTVLVDGWRIEPPLPSAVLDAVRASLRGKSPAGY
jgi:hypothetical protein